MRNLKNRLNAWWYYLPDTDKEMLRDCGKNFLWWLLLMASFFFILFLPYWYDHLTK